MLSQCNELLIALTEHFIFFTFILYVHSFIMPNIEINGNSHININKESDCESFIFVHHHLPIIVVFHRLLCIQFRWFLLLDLLFYHHHHHPFLRYTSYKWRSAIIMGKKLRQPSKNKHSHQVAHSENVKL